jgi:hypothetical protein
VRLGTHGGPGFADASPLAFDPREAKELELAMANSDNYVVSTHEREPGKWQGEIRRRDGGEMQVEGTRKRVVTIALTQSSGEAMMLAYQALANGLGLDVVDFLLLNPVANKPQNQVHEGHLIASSCLHLQRNSQAVFG